MMWQERRSCGHPEDLWASSLSFSFLICGNGNEDLSRGGAWARTQGDKVCKISAELGTGSSWLTKIA